MSINSQLEAERRSFLKGLALGAGGMMLSPMAQPQARADKQAETLGRPMRFVFFLQNHGLKPLHCRPKDIKIRDGNGGYGEGGENINIKGKTFDTTIEQIDRVLDEPLKAEEFPETLSPLAEHAERVSIVQYLQGKHIRPHHGAGYGALGGAQLISRRVPSVETIDCALGKMFPSAFPVLGFGWQGLKGMQSAPVSYCSSAWAARRPAPGYSNPILALSDLFGAGGTGELRDLFDQDTEALDRLYHDVQRMNKSLSGVELAKFKPLVDGYQEMTRRRSQLASMADKLRRHAPTITEKFTAPKFETDWREANFEVATAALVAGLTNVLTIATGMCNVWGGPLDGLDLPLYNHPVGHSAPESSNWVKIHRYNMRLLSKLIKSLEAVPEGNGTMMDNTLIVYTSCHAETQHSIGDRWPFILIGDLGGRIRTGRYIHYPHAPRPKSRSVNALYTTILQAAGSQRDNFNLVGALEHIDRTGPLEELLV